MTKKLIALILSFSLILSLFQAVGLTAFAAEPTVTRFSSTDDVAVAEFMMGSDIKTDKNLLYGAFPKQVSTYSSSASTVKYYSEATNTGTGGKNVYSISGSNSNAHVDSTVALTDGLVPRADNDLQFTNSIWGAATHHVTFEYDLGSSCTLNDFYVCFSSRAKGDERIAKAYELYASDSLSSLYSAPIATVSDNTDGMNKVTFPEGTSGRYFAFRITAPDNGTPSSYVYPRCKEIALSGTHKSANWASLNPLNVQYKNDPGDATLAHWMDGLSPTDPSNIILNKTPSVTYYQPGSSTPVSDGNIGKYSNGVFDDGYFNSHWSDSTYMLDSTYAEVVWDLGAESRFSEFWVTFRPEINGNAFIMPKYALYCGNDKATLFDSDPIIFIDCNSQNINKIKMNERTARYFGLLAICPNISTWGSNQSRLSIQEAALIGPAKRYPNVSVVDSKGQEIDITIGGASTSAYEGEQVTLTAENEVKLGSKTYLFDGFFENNIPLSATLSGGKYSAKTTISATNKVVAKYSKAVTVSEISAYVANNVMTDIGSAVSSVKKIDTSYTISSELTYQSYGLLGWMINSSFVSATADGKLTITLEDDTSIKAIYANAEGAEVVIFKAKNGDQLGTFIIEKGKPISSVATPEKLASLKMPLVFGYTQSGWSVDLDEPCNASLTITPTYTQNSETYPLTIDGEASANVKFDQKITLNSDDAKFSSLKNGDSIITTDKESTIYAPGKIDLKSNAYGENTQVKDAVNLMNGISWEKAGAIKYNLTVLASIDGIKEEDFIECGVVFTDIDTYKDFDTTSQFVISDKTIHRGLTSFPTDGVYMITLSGINAAGERAARAYVKYYKDGKETIEYSRTALTAKKDAANMPEAKYENAITKYANHKSIPLYEDNAIPYYNATFAAQTINSSTESGNNPTIAPYLVEGAKACVVIYPGGGYYQRSDNGEGVKIAQAYNNAGYSAFVVRYRCGNNSNYNNGYNDQAIITDGQRAVQFVRYHAEEFGISPDKIAVCGFSAGGHLAMSVSQNQMEGNVVGDAAGKLSNIPNATILGYAVTTLLSGTFGTMPPILGANHTAAEKTAINNKYSGHLHATADTAPTFLFYGTADTAVPPDYNSVAYYNALIAAGAKAEIHAYEGFGHGFGIGSGAAAEWHSKSVTFLKNIAGLEAAK